MDWYRIERVSKRMQKMGGPNGYHIAVGIPTCGGAVTACS